MCVPALVFFLFGRYNNSLPDKQEFGVYSNYRSCIMGFWIFMLIMDFLIPVVVVGFGSYFAKMYPKRSIRLLDTVHRYMKNKETRELHIKINFYPYI